MIPSRFFALAGVPLLLAALVLSGCDASDASDNLDPIADASADEDAVVSIAAALAVEGGERTLVYDLSLTYLDVRGPRGRDWPPWARLGRHERDH